MKKYFCIVAVAASMLLSSCMMNGGMATNGNNAPAGASQMGNASGLIGNLISTFASGILTNQATLVGTWTYAKPCVQFESENLLAQAGGTVAATSIENKLATYYSKVGLTAGKAQFIFGNDNTLQYTIGGRTMTGRYTFDATKRTVTITTQSGINVTAYVSISLNQMALTFDASKMLSLVNAASAVSSSLSSLTAVTGSFKGMKLGFTFSK